MTGALRSLTITAFRGSTQTLRLDFEPKRTLSLVYGENGTGKTTICDAFEFLAREELGSLSGRGLGGSLQKFWHSAGREPGEMMVELETASGICAGRFEGTKPSVSPAAARPRVEVLRRQQVLELVEAQPARRYDALKRFIEIDAFERSEGTLRDLTSSIAADLKDANNALLQSLGTLDDFRKSGDSREADIVAWAEAQLAQPSEDRKRDIERLEALRRDLQALGGYPGRFEAASARRERAASQLATARRVHGAATAVAASDTAETILVLKAGLEFLTKSPEAPACPLCESGENVAALSERLKKRLSSLQGFQSTLAEVSRCEAAAQDADGAWESLCGEYIDVASRFAEALVAIGDIASGRPDPPPTDPAGLAGWLTRGQPFDEAWAERTAGWRQQGQLHETLRKQVEACRDNRAKVEELERLRPLAQQALELVVQERQTFTSHIIGEIAEEVGRLYEAVHPGEGLDRISLPLDPKKRASLGLHASFGGSDGPPQAYFSQSHLDTLGLCVFLALALRERASETILILDDVLGSVDEPHVERVIGMIYDVSQRFRHTLVTTHYRPWREKYRWGWLKAGHCHFVELTTWRLADGVRLTTSKPEVARLKALLAEADIDAQSACGKAGIILEAMLDHLTLKYGCAVPRRFGDAYTLGDLLPAIDKKLKAALRVDVMDLTVDPAVAKEAIALAPILEELSRIAQARNVFGAHFKVLGMEMPEADAIAFAKEVEKLADALICPDHGWPGNDKSGSYWKNSGDTRRLHPLKKPG